MINLELFLNCRVIFGGGAIVLLCANCTSSNTKYLTIKSFPEGASIIESGSGAKFQSPVTLTYELPESSRDSRGCFQVREYMVKWASGASAVGISLMCGNHQSWETTVQRPSDVPNVEQDIAVANIRMSEILNAQTAALAQQRRQDALGQIVLMGLSGVAAGYSESAGRSHETEPQRPVQCNSQIVLNQVYTQCR